MYATDLFRAEVTGIIATALAAHNVTLAVTDPVAISITTSVATVLIAAVSAYFAYKAKAKAEETSKDVNGHLTEFKRIAEEVFTSRGKEQERVETREREAAKDAGIIQEKVAEQLRKAEQKLPSVPAAIPVEGIKTLPP